MSRWEDFFEDYGYAGEVKQLATLYPDKKSVEVAYDDIDSFDPEFAQLMEIKPDSALEKAKAAMRVMIEPLLSEEFNGMRVGIRIKDFPRYARVGIRNIRETDIGTLICIEGVARRVTEVRPKAVIAAFQCVRCGHITNVPQNTPLLTEPMECAKDAKGGGGCGRVRQSTKFRYLAEKSVLYDSEKIEVQEHPDGLRGGAQAQAIVCHAYEDICGKTTAGDKVIITGILRAMPKNQKYTTHDIYLEVNHIELVDVEQEEIEISPGEQAEIDALVALDNVQEVLSSSIAPSIYGHNIIKKAMMLQVFGGIAKNTPDGTRLRGDIHMLLVGDPGTAKTQMIRYMSQLVPRSVYASGKSSSAAGLTACATKNEFGEGSWTLEAGALVLADGGLAVVDELDKMSTDDRSAMHEAMESQSITVHKASIHASLQSRCSVLAAANPKHGRFMPNAYISEQIDLPPTLFSRFDLIFPITDKPEAELDAAIADHILNSHVAGQAKRREDAHLEVAESARIELAKSTITPRVSPELLRKYVFLGRKIIPMLSEKAVVLLKAYYQEVRSYGYSTDSPVPITARQLEGLVRLAEASAKSRMSETVEEWDAMVSISITREFLDRVVSRGDSGMDIDSITGNPKGHRDIIVLMEKIVREMSEGGNSWPYEDFETECISRGISKQKVGGYFDRMVSDGAVYYKLAGGSKRYMGAR